eukprot:364615-Chlamydomonas_euryale.AAC.57
MGTCLGTSHPHFSPTATPFPAPPSSPQPQPSHPLWWRHSQCNPYFPRSATTPNLAYPCSGHSHAKMSALMMDLDASDAQIDIPPPCNRLNTHTHTPTHTSISCDVLLFALRPSRSLS